MPVPIGAPALALTTAVAGSMIGELGALGGGFIPNAMGLSKQHYGTYFYGFLAFAILGVRAADDARNANRWTRTWAERVAAPVPVAAPLRLTDRKQSRLDPQALSPSQRIGPIKRPAGGAFFQFNNSSFAARSAAGFIAGAER